MNLQEIIDAFNKLGDFLKKDFLILYSNEINKVELKNPWYTKENINNAIEYWSKHLDVDMLSSWITPYKLDEVIISEKKVLVVLAGNIPLVGFHDFLTVLISGFKVVVKLSSNDNILLPLIVSKLIEIDSRFSDRIDFIEDVKNKIFDAVIATGSDNSARYFEYYFKESKKIIRNSRSSLAILDGNETEDELNGLASDIFSYFGLGCRNVSKLFLPVGYDIDQLFSVFYNYKDLIHHKKYQNNYDYNKTMLLMGNNKFVENGFFIMKEDSSLFSPVAMLYYEFYSSRENIKQFISAYSSQIQCVVSKNNIQFGRTQKPELWDYSDGIDTIDFLRDL